MQPERGSDFVIEQSLSLNNLNIYPYPEISGGFGGDNAIIFPRVEVFIPCLPCLTVMHFTTSNEDPEMRQADHQQEGHDCLLLDPVLEPRQADRDIHGQGGERCHIHVEQHGHILRRLL